MSKKRVKKRKVLKLVKKCASIETTLDFMDGEGNIISRAKYKEIYGDLTPAWQIMALMKFKKMTKNCKIFIDEEGVKFTHLEGKKPFTKKGVKKILVDRVEEAERLLGKLYQEAKVD